MVNTGGIDPYDETYAHQQCFVAYPHAAEWRDDVVGACNEVLPKFGLQPRYAKEHFDPTQTLRDGILEFIDNSHCGIYDISSWQDHQGRWHLCQNVFIELGIAIALNRPTVLLRHATNKKLPLPICLQGLEMLDFAGTDTLKKALTKRLPEWINRFPDNKAQGFCIFGNKLCEFRGQHPYIQKPEQALLDFHIADGLDKLSTDFYQLERDEIRSALQNIFGDSKFEYLDELPLINGYQHRLCNECQIIRSTPCGIYRIIPQTPADVFVAIGISIALDKLFDYTIPRMLLVPQPQNLPSLLQGYKIIKAVNTTEIKDNLIKFLPQVKEIVKQTFHETRHKSLVHLGQWLENVFQEGWHPPEAVLPAYRRGTSHPQPIAGNLPEANISRIKLFDLGAQQPGSAISLLVRVTQTANEEFDICLRVYPLGSLNFLPPGLRLTALDDKENIVLEVHAKSHDDWVQLELTSKARDMFSITIALLGFNFTETFMI